MEKLTLLIICLVLICCKDKDGQFSGEFIKHNTSSNNSTELIEVLNSKKTGISFENKIEETVQLNYFNFMHLYMGAGIATADFNNDGLQDIFFVSNLFQDKLYLNKGEMTFEDISKQSGITKSKNTFSTGVTIVDINSDGFLDIYLCRSGPLKTGDLRLSNKLYVNNGDLTFTERSKEYGLNETSHSTQALFFDYDLDGDLDLYLVNTPINFKYKSLVVSKEIIANDPKVKQFGSSDKLFKNTNGFFYDVSLQSGMIPEISYGLNAIICDINNDNYPDIHVSNDFAGPDFLYENQKNGTFKEVSLNSFKHTSFFSMGSDVCDINNDGNFDLMVLDMSLTDYKESKTSMSMGNRENFRSMLRLDHNYQYMHNMLHLGNGSSGFSEVSQLSGLDKTDWSWSVLFVDFDHDGLKDLYVTNGIKHNVQDQDGQAKRVIEMNKLKANNAEVTKEKIDFLAKLLPESKKTNYIFKNRDGLKFDLKNDIWLSEEPGITQGSAFADFDNDGDIDIVLNNTNKSATILKNLSSEKALGNSIIIQLRDSKSKNYNGIGAIIELESNGVNQKQIMSSNRGYFSASEFIAHFGVGNANTIDKIKITWPNREIQTIENVKANQKLIVEYLPNKKQEHIKPFSPLFTEVKNQTPNKFLHLDEYSDDFKTQVLIPHSLSSYGPKLIKGDLNNDGLKDIYITGGPQQNGAVFYNRADGFDSHKINASKAFEKEETCGAIADFNNDGFNDIYVGCGSYQFNKTSEVTDYMLFGSANNTFTNASKNMPVINTNTSKVLPFDYDQDGDLDLFIGSRVVSGAYPLSPKNYILQNNKGSFTDVTKSVAPDLEYYGMITDSDWQLENNKIQLVVVGEWTGIGLFEFDGKQFNLLSNNISKKYGWWNSVKFADLNKDGKKDIIAGNLGLNYKFHASEEKPFQMYYGDINKNGSQEIILTKKIDGDILPIRGKECSAEQMPFVSEKFPSFNEFANQDVFGIYGEELKNANQYKATMFETAIFINNGNDFETRILPYEAQFSTVNGIVVTDVNNDGNQDLILAGNMYESEIETTKADAGKGVVLINDGKAVFKVLDSGKSGFNAEHNVKSLELIEAQNKNFIFVGNNNRAIQLFTFKKHSSLN